MKRLPPKKSQAPSVVKSIRFEGDTLARLEACVKKYDQKSLSSLVNFILGDWVADEPIENEPRTPIKRR